MLATYWNHASKLTRVVFWIITTILITAYGYVTYVVIDQKGVDFLLEQFGGSWLTYVLYVTVPLIPYFLMVLLSGWARYTMTKGTDNFKA